MAFTAAVATVASAGLSAYSTYQQTKAAKAQANYQSAIARNNVIIAQHNQIRIKQQADEAEADQRRRTCLLYTSPSPRDATLSRMPSSA